MKKLTLMFVMMVTSAGLIFGCGKADDQVDKTLTENTSEVDVDEADDDENYETGDASLDDPLNQDGIGEQEILVVSFGTSYNDNRRETIGAIEKAMIDEFTEWDVRRGFTAQIIIDHVFRRDGEVIDNFSQAMDRAVDNGVKVIVIQPTHLMNGLEYNDVVDEAAQYADAFDKIVIGRPLLDTDDDFDKVADAIVADTASYDAADTAIVFMGHGTEAESNKVYSQMQKVLNDKGHDNYFIATVEAEPSFDDVIKAVKDGGYSKVVLQPLMIVAGDHANNDMAGDEEDSLKSLFEAEGLEVTCVVKGLGSNKVIQGMLVQKAQDAIDSLDK